jgi:hypothetical protein
MDMGLKDFEEKQQHKNRHLLKRYPELIKVFKEVMKEAEENDISDTVAAQYLIEKEKLLKNKSYNTVRRYFKDIRDGII